MDEHHAEVAVAVLGDPAQAADVPGGVLPGREPEVGGEAPAGAEPLRVAD